MVKDTEAKAAKAAERAAKKQADGPDDSLQISRMLVRAIWSQEWSAANPEAGPETRKAAWQAAREGVMGERLKPYRKALNIIGKMGVTMAVTAKSDEEPSDEADSDE